MPDNESYFAYPPEPETEAKPILRPPAKPILPCNAAEQVPKMITHFGFWDYLCMGLKRAIKTTLYVGAASGAVAGIGVMTGVPLILALKGAGMIVAGGAIASGVGKMWEEKLKQEGKSPVTEKFVTWIISILGVILKAYFARKNKEVTK